MGQLYRLRRGPFASSCTPIPNVEDEARVLARAETPSPSPSPAANEPPRLPEAVDVEGELPAPPPAAVLVKDGHTLTCWRVP